MLPPTTKVITFESKDPAWSYKIEHAEFMRSGDTSTLVIEVTPPDVFGNEFNTGAATVQLDYPGLFQGVRESTQMIDVGKSGRFSWTLGPAAPGHYEGRVWIYNGLDRMLMNVRTLEVEVRGPAALARLFMRIAIMIAAGVGLYLLLSALGAKKK